MSVAPAAKTVCLGIATPEGEFFAHYSAQGLVALHFPAGYTDKAESIPQLSPLIRQWHRQTAAAVRAILAGRPPVKLPPLDLAGGTKFQQSVWAALRKIKPGHTRNYGEIAESIGNPKAVRAVGGACGANPIPLLVPCHRVLAANQKIGGFSGGLEWKRKLLEREGIVLD